jgi:hypothetical protein
MLSRIRGVITRNAIALVALFIALGGTAAALTGHNSVRSDDIAPGAVHRSDVANSTGKAYSRAITVVAGPATPTILKIPSLGKLSVKTCASDAVATTFKAPAGSQVRLGIVITNDNEAPHVNTAAPAPGQEISTVGAMRQFVTWQPTRGTGGSTEMATVTETSGALGDDTCTFSAQAVVQRK